MKIAGTISIPGIVKCDSVKSDFKIFSPFTSRQSVWPYNSISVQSRKQWWVFYLIHLCFQKMCEKFFQSLVIEIFGTGIIKYTKLTANSLCFILRAADLCKTDIIAVS